MAEGSTLERLKKEINKRFSIKEWQDMGEKEVTFLGVKTKYTDGIFYDDMSDYVANLREADIDKSAKKDQPLGGSALSAYRRLIMQLRWPAHLVMPEFLYVTSAMAQKVTTATFADLVEGIKVLKTHEGFCKRLEEQGLPSVHFKVTRCLSPTLMPLWAVVVAELNKVKFT